MALDPVDMRKSFDGLSAVMREQLDLDPLSGHIVLFRNSRGNMLKILFFDRVGFTIVYRRLERGTFQLPDGEGRAEIDPADLAMILEGIDLRSAVRRARYSRAADVSRNCGLAKITLEESP